MISFVKSILPPFLYDWIYYSSFRSYGWFGDYLNWDEAEKKSKGYDSTVILEKVKHATLKMKAGTAVYERDSVLFDIIHYDWPVLAGLLWIAAKNEGKLNVVDFGGSLGSTYWQNRKFLIGLKEVRWNIIEQPHFVKNGIENLQDGQLRFYNDFEACLKANSPQVILLSSVLPYLREPYELLLSLLRFNIEFIIIDRIPLIQRDRDRITVQKVPPHIYEASYPAWFFSEKKFRDFITTHFEIIEEYDCNLRLSIPALVKGMILKRRNTL